MLSSYTLLQQYVFKEDLRLAMLPFRAMGNKVIKITYKMSAKDIKHVNEWDKWQSLVRYLDIIAEYYNTNGKVNYLTDW